MGNNVGNICLSSAVTPQTTIGERMDLYGGHLHNHSLTRVIASRAAGSRVTNEEPWQYNQAP